MDSRWGKIPTTWRALVTEGLGEGVAQSLVVGRELADVLVSELEALPERAVAGSLPGRHGRWCCWPGLVLADLGEQVGLRVDPGARHAGPLGEDADHEGLTGAGQFPQGGQGASAGALGPGSGGFGQVAAVIGSHRSPRVARARDDRLEVVQDLLVHLRHRVASLGLGAGDELDDLGAVLAVSGQVRRGGQKHRTGQAGVGVRAGILDRQGAVATARRAATALLTVRADSAYYNHDVVAAARKAGARFSLTARMDPAVVAAISRIHEAIWDADECRWVSDAEVAEITYTVFTLPQEGRARHRPAHRAPGPAPEPQEHPGTGRAVRDLPAPRRVQGLTADHARGGGLPPRPRGPAMPTHPDHAADRHEKPAQRHSRNRLGGSRLRLVRMSSPSHRASSAHGMTWAEHDRNSTQGVAGPAPTGLTALIDEAIDAVGQPGEETSEFRRIANARLVEAEDSPMTLHHGDRRW